MKRTVRRCLIILCLCILTPRTAWAYEYNLGPLALNFSGYVEGLGVYALREEAPKEPPSLLGVLSTKSDFGDWGGFKLTLKGLHDGKVKHPGNPHVVCELDKVYQDKNPSLSIDEAYVDLFTGKADVRIGIQKFAWGRLDEINPTDNFNTQDMTNPFLYLQAERKIGVPAVKASLYSSLVNCEIGWAPRYVPYRLPRPGERWFPPMLIPPETVDTGTVAGSIPVAARYDEIELPAWNLRNSEAGLRLMKTVAGWELSASYFTGYDVLPVAACPTDVYVVLDNPMSLRPDLTALLIIKPEVHRMHIFGADFSTTWQGFTIRGEGAYMRGKRYFRTQEAILADFVADTAQQERLKQQFLDEFQATGATHQVFAFDTPIQIKKNAFKGGLGLDYMHGDHTVSVQLIHEYLFAFDQDEPVYLIKDGADTTVSAAYKGFYLHNTLDVTLAGAYDIQFKGWLAQPSLAYSFSDALKGTLGCLFIGGAEHYSLLGQFREHDEVFCKLRYSF